MGKMFSKSSPLKLLGLLGPNFDGMVLWWSPFRIVSNDLTRQPRQPTSAHLVLTWDPMGKMLKIFFSETTSRLGPSYARMVLRWSPIRILSVDRTRQRQLT